MSILHRFKFAGLVAAVCLLLGACATSPPQQLTKAREAYQQAQQSNAAKYAPTELAQAKRALIQAEQAYEEGGNAQRVATLAYVATRRSQAAIAQGKVNYLVTTRQAKQNELFARTEAARQQYQRELIRQRQMAQMSQQQLEQKRQQLEQARERLEKQGLNAEQMAQRQRDYEAAIAKLNVEIERRKQAEQQVSQLQDKLAKIADVSQQDGRGTVITLDNSVLFAVGESELLPNARQRLEQVANALKLRPDSDIVIEGYTDSQGPNSLNERLSEERADSVREFLVSRGVASNRIKTIGYGEERPIAPNSTPEGRAMNRRVEIVVNPTEAVGGGPGKQNQEDMQDEDMQDEDMQNEDMQDQPMQDEDMQDQPMQDEDMQNQQMPEDQDIEQQEPTYDESVPSDESPEPLEQDNEEYPQTPGD